MKTFRGAATARDPGSPWEAGRGWCGAGSPLRPRREGARGQKGRRVLEFGPG